MDESQNINEQGAKVETGSAGGDDMKSEIAALKVEFEALKKERDELKKQLGEQRGQALIKQAELDGKLTPAMIAEGSAYVEIAYTNAALFKRLMDVTPVKMAGNRLTIKDNMNEDEPQDSEDALIVKAEKIMAEKNVDFAEALRLAHLEG